MKKYKSIQRLKAEYRSKFNSEIARITELKNLQQRVQNWIRHAGVSWLEITVSEPNSSGYRYCAIDIHSPNEAYIFWTNGGYGYNYLVSIFADDFGNLSEGGGYQSSTGEILYACNGLLRIVLSSEEIAKLTIHCKSDHLSCCHTKIKK